MLVEAFASKHKEQLQIKTPSDLPPKKKERSRKVSTQNEEAIESTPTDISSEDVSVAIRPQLNGVLQQVLH